ncbi:MAG TPA: ribosomal RNA small subunit methyltransferase A [Candidatus Diapherotrites archaeon]|uniref:Ribosomal RNA small subunit methyltransferase A n=1 Tax=Candidatus Iainarchaeum sp. TaxID=3101447 RepID=A0A7J4IY36_9ARCH|nr:ribosomal RNA small subunit methyltransferase A [Candidatus Diapherotrites archaeon]
MPLFSDLNDQMAKYRFRPDQRFGQNFAINEPLLERMVELADLNAKDTVLEIGCGTGFLTEKLVKKCKVIGYELDRNLAGLLRGRFKDEKNFRLIEEDIVFAKLPKFTKVVSLPPYNISTQVMLKLISSKAMFERAVLVFQTEFCEKLTAEPGFPDYNYLSVLARLSFDPKIALKNISPASFFPKPESYSSVIVLQRRDAPKVAQSGDFIFFIKNLFRYKNKNLSNALSNCLSQVRRLGIKDEKMRKALENSGIGDEKVSLLEPEIFAELFSRISR